MFEKLSERDNQFYVYEVDFDLQFGDEAFILEFQPVTSEKNIYICHFIYNIFIVTLYTIVNTKIKSKHKIKPSVCLLF